MILSRRIFAPRAYGLLADTSHQKQKDQNDENRSAGSAGSAAAAGQVCDPGADRDRVRLWQEPIQQSSHASSDVLGSCGGS